MDRAFRPSLTTRTEYVSTPGNSNVHMGFDKRQSAVFLTVHPSNFATRPEFRALRGPFSPDPRSETGLVTKPPISAGVIRLTFPSGAKPKKATFEKKIVSRHVMEREFFRYFFRIPRVILPWVHYNTYYKFGNYACRSISGGEIRHRGSRDRISRTIKASHEI